MVIVRATYSVGKYKVDGLFKKKREAEQGKQRFVKEAKMKKTGEFKLRQNMRRRDGKKRG